MLDRNKNKLKIQINKALQTVNNIIKPTSDIKQTLENTYKDINVEKTDKVHGMFNHIQIPLWILKRDNNSLLVNTIKIQNLITIDLLIQIDIILFIMRKLLCLRRCSEIWKIKEIYCLVSMLGYIMVKKVVFPIFMFTKHNKD